MGIEALRAINRIVLAIQERIEAAERTPEGNHVQTFTVGDPRGSKNTNANCGTDTNGGEEECR